MVIGIRHSGELYRNKRMIHRPQTPWRRYSLAAIRSLVQDHGFS